MLGGIHQSDIGIWEFMEREVWSTNIYGDFFLPAVYGELLIVARVNTRRFEVSDF